MSALSDRNSLVLLRIKVRFLEKEDRLRLFNKMFRFTYDQVEELEFVVNYLRLKSIVFDDMFVFHREYFE